VDVKRKKLTEEQWRVVFQLRCRSKQGQHLAQEDRELLAVAFNEDSKRYGAMEPDVFNTTAPFGSDVRWRKS
jgi:hypothetical protein